MSDYKLQETFELQKFTKNISGLTISEIFDREIVNFSFHIKNEKIIKTNFKKLFNFEFPDFRISTFDKKNNCRFLRMSDEQIFLIFNNSFNSYLSKNLKEIEKYFYITEQTDAWTGIKISGENVRECLERICLIDIREECFPENSFSRTHIEHLGSIIINSGNNEFELFSAKSSSKSFLDSIITSAINIS